MKKNLLLSILALAVIATSCKKNDDDATPNNPSGSYKVEYKNQVLQGKINGEAWTFAQGDVHSTDGGFNLEFNHFFNLIDTAQSDTCYAISGERSKVIFSLEDSISFMSPGKFPLSFDFNTFNGRTVTLVDWTETTVLNTILSEGEYEVLSVDTVNKIVTARMDAYSDANNFVNGNFTVKYCYW